MNTGEFDFIKTLQKQFFTTNNNELGIGDDCAVLPIDEDNSYLASTDLLCENVHFSFDFMTWKELGWKSIAVNLSDIAAMGGTAKYIFISIALPKRYFTNENLTSYYQGVKEICTHFDVTLMGGDTSSSNTDLFLSITVMGVVKNNKILYRSGAKLGDFIYITGNIGDSSYGLNLLQKKDKYDQDSYFKNKHLYPYPRLKEMEFLNKRYQLNSAIDLSDGLAGDLDHILKASHVGAAIDWKDIPLSTKLTAAIEDKEIIQKHALNGGEDYEILFTSPDKIPGDILAQFNTQVTNIGQVNEINLKTAILLIDGEKIILKPEGFDHFRN